MLCSWRRTQAVIQRFSYRADLIAINVESEVITCDQQLALLYAVECNQISFVCERLIYSAADLNLTFLSSQPPPTQIGAWASFTIGR